MRVGKGGNVSHFGVRRRRAAKGLVKGRQKTGEKLRQYWTIGPAAFIIPLHIYRQKAVATLGEALASAQLYLSALLVWDSAG